ncbi:protein FAM200C-like [Palaemon carinicauda]|uniref:protein FAM200C-like n=1 Tax=Palaemon carinicauda TaxID=392227 RepID=UPI0035B68A76
MEEAACLVLDLNCVNKVNPISFSDNIVNQRINDMSQKTKSQILLAAEEKKTELLLNDIQGPFKSTLAYLADVFQALNELNWPLQVPNATSLMPADAIKAFLNKLTLWKRKVERVNLQQTIGHNSFRCTVDDLPDDIQEEFFKVINKTAVNEEFQDQQQFNSSNCWVMRLSAFPKTKKIALKVVIPFSSSYLCHSGSSTLLVIKSKAKYRLYADADMQCASSHRDPRFNLHKTI